MNTFRVFIKQFILASSLGLLLLEPLQCKPLSSDTGDLTSRHNTNSKHEKLPGKTSTYVPINSISVGTPEKLYTILNNYRESINEKLMQSKLAGNKDKWPLFDANS